MPAKKTNKNVKSDSMSAFKVLAVAMQTEIEGYEFYKLAAAKCKDNGAKEMFESLAKDEVEHHKILRERYYSIIDDDKAKFPKIKGKSRLNIKSPVFSKQFLESKKQKHFEMSALTVGILLEQNAIEFFNNEYKKSNDPNNQKLFKELAVWEGEHLRALIAQKGFLHRAIFAEARFEPM